MRTANRRTLALFLTLLMLAGLLPVTAAAGNDVLLSMDGAKNEDGFYSVTLSINEGTGVEMMQFALDYDAALLKLKSCSPGNAFDTAIAPTIGQQEGRIYFVWDALEPLEGGVLLVMEFQIEANASACASFSLAGDEDIVFANGEYESIAYTFLPFSISPEAEEKSDAESGGQSDTPKGVTKGFSSGLTLERQEAQLSVGESITLRAKGSEKLVWSSGNESIATVNSEGVVTAVGEGQVIITAESEDGTRRAACVISVERPALEETAEKGGGLRSVWLPLPLTAALSLLILMFKKRKNKI